MDSASACRILDGKVIAEPLLNALTTRIKGLKTKPKLSVIIAGHSPPSEIYVKVIQKKAARVGLICEVVRYEDVTRKRIIEDIGKLNKDSSIHGIIILLPLPPHLDSNEICDVVAPIKDVDCLTSENIGKLCRGDPVYVSCSSNAVLTLLNVAGVDAAGKQIVMIARSIILGKPLSVMLGDKGAIMTICPSNTSRQLLAEICLRSDVIVSAVGVPNLISGDMVKQGAVVIDVGDYVTGDVDFNAVREKASALSPVPGGVGPITGVSLLQNTVLACEKQT